MPTKKQIKEISEIIKLAPSKVQIPHDITTPPYIPYDVLHLIFDKLDI